MDLLMLVEKKKSGDVISTFKFLYWFDIADAEQLFEIYGT